MITRLWSKFTGVCVIYVSSLVLANTEINPLFHCWESASPSLDNLVLIITSYGLYFQLCVVVPSIRFNLFITGQC